MLFRQEARMPWYFARARAGNSSPARMEMIAITTSSSIKVKPCQEIKGRFPRSRLRAWPKIFIDRIYLMCSVKRYQRSNPRQVQSFDADSKGGTLQRADKAVCAPGSA